MFGKSRQSSHGRTSFVDKRVATKIFIEAFEYSYTNTNAISMDKTDEFDFIKPALKPLPDARPPSLLANVMNERKRKLQNTNSTAKCLLPAPPPQLRKLEKKNHLLPLFSL
ncbi:AcOrf-107 peptide [Autographa californica nucleopolyhedrovirus]|uniref:Uncharacterized 12.5 kDa protein in HE65-PK2 intergenic region n=2 Tax=Autographa californica nuclear polyhedrosis virus TaxID=46015 RepID=Y107_NPVAC|nr:AcOrf-107 peptide [Autographa californica nucleopolyhedrovirus]P41660.1 RecName: Full=Uncharacterized 12.5 kDa protein in HE65-PK2 intergenic region [Autographa californica nucleopolyhedrovirus]AAA66737.1 AcOrf-107 peptide [Autographa californica nucleopolyhedrovirus]AGQ56810.1 hypothetical protein bAcMK109 [Autographa californica nucleopolyhedrovirus]